jgi:hypothetical protein
LKLRCTSFWSSPSLGIGQRSENAAADEPDSRCLRVREFFSRFKQAHNLISCSEPAPFGIILTATLSPQACLAERASHLADKTSTMSRCHSHRVRCRLQTIQAVNSGQAQSQVDVKYPTNKRFISACKHLDCHGVLQVERRRSVED